MSPKSTPVRTCIGCRQAFAKKELVRVVRTPEHEIKVDPKGKISGRGAYLCSVQCLEKVLTGRQLEKALQVKIDAETKKRLAVEVNEQIP